MSIRLALNILSDDELLEIFSCCRLNIGGTRARAHVPAMAPCHPRILDILAITSLLHTWQANSRPAKVLTTASTRQYVFLPGGRAERPMSTKDEEGGSLALHCANWQQHHRVRFIGLREPALQELLPVLDKPFPMLEDLTLTSSHLYYRSRLPETFSAPRLRHLDLVQVGDIPNFLPCKISRVIPLTPTSTRVLVPRVRRLTAGSL